MSDVVADGGTAVVESIDINPRLGMAFSENLHIGRFQEIWRRLERTAARLNARWGRPAQHLLRWGIPILLLAFLGYSLTRLGWGQMPRYRWS